MSDDLSWTNEFIIFDYCLDLLHLLCVTEIDDLGFLYFSSQDFRPYIDFIVDKALRLLGFIKRHSSNFDSPKCLQLFVAL
jgi:hypothetical protein